MTLGEWQKNITKEGSRVRKSNVSLPANSKFGCQFWLGRRFCQQPFESKQSSTCQVAIQKQAIVNSGWIKSTNKLWLWPNEKYYYHGQKNIWANFITKRLGYQTKNIDETYKWYLGSDEKIFEEVRTNLIINSKRIFN